MLKRLTEKQLRVFNVICNTHATTKLYPTIADVASAIGTTRDPAYAHLKRLMKKGYVKPNEQGKYVPTGEGISQRIADFTRLDRVFKPKQNFDRFETKQYEEGA